MFKTVKFVLAACTVATLVACGGGSGGSTVAQAPVASTSSFDLQAASKSQASTPNSVTFTVGGTISGYALTGSGTATNGAMTASTFEGAPALQRTSTVTGKATANGADIPLATSGVSWTDSNYNLLGMSGGNEYTVLNSSPTIPTVARVNDTGAIYTAKRYTNSTKTILIGSIAVTYVVEADTASTALVTLISDYKNTSGTTTKTATAQMRVTTSNSFTRVKETLVDTANALTMTLNY